MSTWPTGDGEMAGRIRAFGWAATPLGAIETWPPTLRFAVDLVLDSPGPAILLWGPKLTQIYNDAWRSVMRRKHPAALGQPTHGCFPEIADTMAPLYARALAGEGVLLDDMLLPILRDGEIQDAWWTVRYVPLRDDEGAAAGVFCTVIETTEAVKAERARDAATAALRESEARLRIERELLDAVIRQAPVGISIADAAEGRVITSNDRLKAMLGRDETGSDARRFARYRAVDREGSPYALDDYPTLRVLRWGETVEREEMLYQSPGAGRDGEVTRFEVSSAPVRDEAGEVVAAVTVVVDVEAQRRAESVLQESEAMLRMALAGGRVASWRWDTRDDMVRADAGLAEMWGLELGEGPFPLSAITDRMAPEGREEMARLMARARAFDQGIDGCVDIVAGPNAGRAVWWRGRARHGEPWILEGVSFDVTEHRRAERALQDSEARLRTLAEGIPQLVWRAAGEGRRTWASPQWTAFTGQPEADSHGLGWLAPVHPEDRAAVLGAWTGAAERGRFEADYRLHHAAEDRYRWFQARATPLRDGHGDVQEWLGTSTDIDDLRRLRERQDVLVAELQHRTRNLIAVVQSIAIDTMEHTGPTEAFRDVFADRLSALSRVQGLLSRAETQPITIAALVHLELDALGRGVPDARVTVDGPEAFLRPSTVQTLALALHELATNARKYGALSHARGALAVSWRGSCEGDEHRLALDWVETGLEHAPCRPPSTGRGYGRELIERALPYALDARTHYALTETGLRCTIDLPGRPDARGEEP